MKKFQILGAALAVAAFACADIAPEPEVTNVTMTQDDTRRVTIGYTLAHAPAVVTIDVQTNAQDGTWASIGGENIQRVAGDVNKVVEGDGAHAITWMPHLSWPGHKITDNGARVVVTAWSPDDTPDYMVLDLASDSTARVAYFPNAGQLPGGILSNKAYRTTHMVMRRIPAANVTWTMGSVAEPGREKDETPHAVTLDRDYYMAVFPTTQAQWDYLVPATNRAAKSTRGPLRPMNNVSYNDVRNSSIEQYNANNNGSYGYPKGPHASSYIGRMRKLSGLADFGIDLPSEAQWEFAARAGHGDGFWGDGTLIRTDASNTDFEGVPGNIRSTGVVDCGLFPPNDWGLYDTVGNVLEWCLDYYEADITGLGGAVNAAGEQTATGNAPVSSSQRVRRSLSYSDTYAWHRSRLAHRARPDDQNSRSYGSGFRLMCYGTLK